MRFLRLLIILYSSLFFLRRQITKNLEYRISNWKTSKINIFFTYMFSRLCLCSFKCKRTRISKLNTIFTVLFICDDPNKNFIFHQNTIFVFFERNEKFKSSKFSTPSMTALITLKFKVSCLFSFYDEKLIAIPLIIILRAKKIRKGFFTGPLNRNPF